MYSKISPRHQQVQNMLVIIPRNFGADISPKYMGTNVHTTPTPIPWMNLAIYKQYRYLKWTTIAHPIMNSGPVVSITVFLPTRSAKMAAGIGLIRIPNWEMVANQEASSKVIWRTLPAMRSLGMVGESQPMTVDAAITLRLAETIRLVSFSYLCTTVHTFIKTVFFNLYLIVKMRYKFNTHNFYTHNLKNWLSSN